MWSWKAEYKQIWDFHSKTDNFKVFHFTLFLTKSNDTILCKLKHASLTFLVSKMGLPILVAQLASALRAKLWKLVMKCKNVFLFNFWALFLKIYLSEVTFFPTYPVNSILTVVARMDMTDVFDKVSFPLYKCFYDK